MPLRGTERWISFVRLVVLPLVLILVLSANFPDGAWGPWAAVTSAVFTVGSVVLFYVARSDFGARRPVAQSVIAQIFDTTVVIGFTMVFAYDAGLPTQQLLYVDLAAACVRFRIRGGLIIAAISAPIIALFEQLRSEYLNVAYSWELVVLQTSVELVLALLLGWLVREVAAGSARAEARAVEAEDLRDELGRRADLADAANRCARALNSSLDVPQAFGAFIRELRGLLPFDRVAIILAEDGVAKVMATAGAGVETVFPPGSGQPLAGTLLDVVMTSQTPVYRRRLDGTEFPEERDFEALGLHSRLAAPLLAGTRPIGMLSLLRREPDGFTQAEIELVGMLGRLVASTAQNLHVYEVERRTVEELRRLSALRADFVSLVSHELRTPMAAVIGSARTLQQRWRDLSPEQRDAFLALIADETDRLAALVGEVLDTLADRRRHVQLRLRRARPGAARPRRRSLPPRSFDAESTIAGGRYRPASRLSAATRLGCGRCSTNLIDNAVKYSPDGAPVEVRATTPNGDVRIAVDRPRRRDRRPRTSALIFEKFGRVHGTSSKPGTGLGLFIARAIAEAHGGTLEVSLAPGRGATFTLTLPLSACQRRVAAAALAARAAGRSSRSSSRARAATRARSSTGSSTTASPRNESTSPIEPLGAARRRAPRRPAPSTSGIAPFSTSQRATSGEYQMRAVVACWSSGRVEPVARREAAAQQLRLRACGRAGSCAARRGRRPRCGRTSAAAGARSCTARPCASSPRSTPASGTRARRALCPAIARVSVATRSSSAPACGVGVCGEVERAEGLLELRAHAVERRVRAGGDHRADELEREPDRARLERRQPRRRARNVSPKSSLSTCTSSPCSSA